MIWIIPPSGLLERFPALPIASSAFIASAVAPGAFSTGSIFQWKRRRLRSGRAALALADEDAMDHRQEPAHPFAGPGSRADAIRADEANQWSPIQAATGCSRATVAKIAKRQAKQAA